MQHFKPRFHLCPGEQTLNHRRLSLQHPLPARGPRVDAMESPMSTLDTSEKPKIYFHVKDMTSARSADAVMGALKELDGRATVRIDLPMRRVEIGPRTAESAAFRHAISNAGYTTLRQWPSALAYF